METLDGHYWTNRYQQEQTGWDVGSVSTPLKAYIDQLTDKNIKILIPGSGNGYEAAYLFEQGFHHVYIVDISEYPLQAFKQRYPQFPADQILHQDFFTLSDSYDLILEQTFFCALQPSLRPVYAQKMYELLKPTGRLVGVLFDDPLFDDHPPFGGNREEYRSYFQPFFRFHTFETAYNSISPRRDRELFINLQKKESDG